MKRLITLPILLISLIASGTNYYVRNGGNDAAAGTSDATAWAHHPWMITWTGTVTLVAGDIVYMNRGDTWSSSSSSNFMTVGQSGTAGNYITTTAYGTGNKPIIKIAAAVTSSVVYASGKSFIKFDNLHIQHNSSSFGSGNGFYLLPVCHDITFTNNEIDNIPYAAILGQTNCYNIIIGDISATSTATNSAYSNHIHDFGYCGIGLMGANPATGESHFSVYYNYVHDSKRTGIGANAYGIFFSANSSSYSWPKIATARYNNVQNILTWEGIDTHGGSYLYFQDNYIKNFGFVGILTAPYSIAGLTPTLNHIYIERNIVEQPVSGWVSGRENCFIIQYDPDLVTPVATDIYIRDNTCFYTSRPASGKFAGIRAGNVERMTISGNKIYNGATSTGIAGIQLTDNYGTYGNKNVTITQNFISQWGPGISINGTTIKGSVALTYNIVTKSPGASITILNGNIPATGALTIYNNTFINETHLNCFYTAYGINAGGSVIAKNNILGQAAPGSFYYWNWGGTISGTFTCDYNLYWNSTNSSPFSIGGIGAVNWFYWNGNLGRDIHGQKSIDPRFRNSSGSYLQDIDFKIQNTSPAVNAGTNLGLVTDYSGAATSGLPDIGAFETQIDSLIYLNSVVENATPSLVEMIYNVAIDDNIIPAKTAFIIQVNGANRTINSVAISGNKVRLTLASPVVFGENVKVSYINPGSSGLRTTSGVFAANITAQTVTNNCLNPTKPNDPPVVVINYSESANSGFVYELDASGSSDPNNDELTYSWTTPANVPVSAITGPKIKFLSPVVTNPDNIEFRLSVNDGRVTQTKNIQVNLMPYKPELGIAKISQVEASNYYQIDYPNNAVDGSLTTKWSSNGDNQWLLLNLAEPFKISHFQIALLPDQKNESYFDIYASKDKIIWETGLINTASCNFSGDMQTFDFPAAKSGEEYSFIKLIGHSNSLNTWNNYSEIKLFGDAGEKSTSTTNNSGNISIYPNPVNDLINVLILEPPSESQSLRIYDFTGALRLEKQIDLGVNNVQIPVDLNPGIYIAEVLLGSIILFTQKLIVIK